MHGSIGGISDLKFDKRRTIGIWQALVAWCIGWRTASGGWSGGSAVFLIVVSDFARFPSLSFISLCPVSLPGWI